MSTPTSVLPAGQPAVQSAGQSAGQPARPRRWLWPVVVLVVAAVACLVTALQAPTTDRGELDPRSVAPNGSRAVARILGAHDVRVDLVERSDAAVDGAGVAETIVVVQPALLGPRQLDRLRATPADLVLVEPDLTVLNRLAPGVTPAGVADDADSVEPACNQPDAAAAGTIIGGGLRYRLADGAAGASGTVGCYPSGDGYGFVQLATGGHRVTVLGQARLLQNQDLAHQGDAALALRTLGARPALRWYLPDPLELNVDDAPSASDLLPTWVRWAFWELLIAVAVALVWRARRLGRVVTEPLPVVVRSAETVEGRARLYRVSRSRDRAAAILRTAALRRLAARLGVPADAPPREVARLAAATAGQDEATVQRWLLGEPPKDDAGLVALAGALDGVEGAVRSIGHQAGRYGGPRRDEGGGRHP